MSTSQKKRNLNGMVDKPMNLGDVYAHLHSKYQVFLKTKAEKWQNVVDVAKMMKNLDEDVLSEMLCFPDANNKCLVYIPNSSSGIWELQSGHHNLFKAITDVRSRIETLIMSRCELAIKVINQEKKNCTEPDIKAIMEKNLKDVSDHLDFLKDIYKTLGRTRYIEDLIQVIKYNRIIDTKDFGYNSTDIFDRRRECVGFADGVFDFEMMSLVRGHTAQKYFVSQYIKYTFEEVTSVSDETYKECSDFLKKIYPNESIKRYVLKSLSDSLRGLKMKRFFVHYNVEGSNGKSTVFALVKEAFDVLFVRCHNGLLYTSQNVAANQSNEELFSVKGKRVVLFSEPNRNQKLSVAFLKDLTGGDEQTTRKNYGSKTTFVFYGSPHILCNKIPEADDIDGGFALRYKCIPYEARFVEKEADVDESINIFLMDAGVEKNFSEWKFAFMKMLIEISIENVAEPEQVLFHTKRILERDNVMKTFVEEAIEKTGNKKDYVTLSDLYDVYEKRFRRDALRKNAFEEEIQIVLGPYILKRNFARKFWLGIQIRNDVALYDEGDDDIGDDDASNEIPS